MSRLRKTVLGIGGVLFTGLVLPYTVERIKGTPPDRIATVLWAPFGRAITSSTGWLAAPAEVSHGRVLLLTLALIVALAVLIAKWRHARILARRVSADFNPTEIQAAAMGWMLQAYGKGPQSLATLYDQFGHLTHAAGGKAFLAREMEGLERAGMLRAIQIMGTAVYELTPQGRDWILDQMARAAEEEKSATRLPVIEAFKPSRIQALAAAVLIDRYPRRLMLEDLAAGMQDKTRSGLRVDPPRVASQGEIAREMEDLAQRHVVIITDPGSQMAYYGLTIPGRDFMLNVRKTQK
jgi:hypothetical protein